MKKNEIGNRYGRLIVIAEAEKKNPKRARWVCQCDCGNIKNVDGHDLRNGHIQSCGCQGFENKIKAATTHHETHTRLYGVWKTMRRRCNSKNHKDYKYYGAKGIKLCDEWNNFSIFQEWAYNNGYKKDAKRGECTLDRIDVNGNYEPSNCRWVDMKSQCQNRRMWGTDTHNHKMITWTYKGETHTVREWSEITGIDNKILRTRKHKGWNIERILTTPPIK